MKHYLPPQIYIHVRSYRKSYPKFDRLIIYDEPRKIRQPGFEPNTPEFNTNGTQKTNENPLFEIESLRRTKTKISDICLCNDFDLFATFTFAKNRQNLPLLKKRMSKFLENQKTRYGKFQYLIIPEFHKDKKSLHFHALIKNYTGELKNSGIRQNRRKMYNIKGYTLGHSTAVKIDNIEKVSTYIKKYITKDMPQLQNQKRYWCSTGLIRPQKEYNPIVDIREYTKIYEKTGMKIYQNNLSTVD